MQDPEGLGCADTEQRDKIRQAQKSIVKETYGAFLNKVSPSSLPSQPRFPLPQLKRPLGSFFENVERRVGSGGRPSTYGFGVGPDQNTTRGTVQEGLRLRQG